MTVVDASAILEILSRSERGVELESALPALDLHAPHLIDLEVLNAIRRWERTGAIKRGAGSELLDAFLAIPVQRHAHTPMLDPIWALRHNLTAYDASYLALAKMLGADLVTMDSGRRKLAARWATGGSLTR